ncbi:DUF362 domain-containing protein [Acetobacterium paludosum]|uniref:DUF362 domain-containing protein n=1 Tax=Acetobacterium paludosum TaxID=52693 RepID=A0A923HTW8_9FIRM|nr:DUF362 domain-containing protein [Acetobacterium paludosum]MBC3888539.1 DUF362 domain-containing protein [Acetobacterium paludosum]
MEKVSVVECQSYTQEEVYQAVKTAIEGIGVVISPNITVLIKPNILSQNNPGQHTITHYALVAALCRILKEKNCRILIGESISFYETGLTQKAFITSGIKEVAEQYDAKLIAFEEERLIRIDQNLVGLKELYIPSVLLEVDMVINACKLKTHSGMRLSGAVKNMFGCLPGGYKQKIHRWTKNEFELSDVILDLHNIIKPALSVMDAIESLDGGPTALGRAVKTARVLASTNAAALDSIAAKMIGYKPEELPILLQAKNRGMIKNFEDIEVVGEFTPMTFKKLVKKDLYRASNKNSIFVKDTYVDLSIDASRCKMCDKCVDICPIGGIKVEDEKMFLDTGECISCYCCMFVCPHNAIKIKSSLMNKLIRLIRRITKL